MGLSLGSGLTGVEQPRPNPLTWPGLTRSWLATHGVTFEEVEFQGLLLYWRAIQGTTGTYLFADGVAVVEATVGGKRKLRFGPGANAPGGYTVPAGAASVVLVANARSGSMPAYFLSDNADNVSGVGLGPGLRVGAVVKTDSAPSSQSVFVANREAGGWVYYKDGVAPSGQTSGNTTEWGNLSIALGAGAQGVGSADVAAILVFDRPLESAQLSALTVWANTV